MMNSFNPWIVFSNRYICDIGPHVFPIDKYLRVAEVLRKTPGVSSESFMEPRPATREELLMAHDANYLDDLFHLRMTKRTMHAELPLNQSIVDLSVLSTGGTLVASERAGIQGYAFHAGGGWHHAFGGHAEGFCYVNDTAVAIRVLQQNQPDIKVAVIDLDLHQGNGTAAIFRKDRNVYTFSMHQENLYPLKQQGTWDIGLNPFTEDKAYLDILGQSLEKIFGEFSPHRVFYLAGADPFQEDQLGQIRLTMEGLRQRDRAVLTKCRDAKVPVTVLLAGGYATNSNDTVQIHVNTALTMMDVFGIAK